MRYLRAILIIVIFTNISYVCAQPKLDVFKSSGYDVQYDSFDEKTIIKVDDEITVYQKQWPSSFKRIQAKIEIIVFKDSTYLMYVDLDYLGDEDWLFLEAPVRFKGGDSTVSLKGVGEPKRNVEGGKYNRVRELMTCLLPFQDLRTLLVCAKKNTLKGRITCKDNTYLDLEIDQDDWVKYLTIASIVPSKLEKLGFREKLK